MSIQSFISREQDYALRITAYLAGLKKGEFISVSKIAETLRISQKFASRIAHKLKKAGVTDSIQGKYGGVFLKASPQNISIWDILNIIGFKIKFNDCLCENFFCELELGCKFHSFFVQQEQVFMDNLKNQKISDYVLSNLIHTNNQ
jgi:Rrf2 family nitric oxide-sensitive transcriptional repressor